MEILLILIQVIILDGILSIDNAAVLGAIASKLPQKALTPRALRWFGKYQQEAALKVGLLGAYLGRGAMIALAGFIIQIPIFQLIGAGYLMYLSLKYFWDMYRESEEGGSSRFEKNVGTFWKTVLVIELADLAFSLDNVLAVVALSSHILIVILGVFISIIIMRFAAGIFIKLIQIEPLLQHAAFVLILAIAIEMILKFFKFDISEVLQFSISMGILTAFVVYGQLQRLVKKGGYRHEQS
ncbi:MAG: DUF475 domain-containing protein [Candidatus Doudnabacteria bacterium]|nr:DUF475 domain-containing protein [Candidatus Doudnabacteria bacterium]